MDTNGCMYRYLEGIRCGNEIKEMGMRYGYKYCNHHLVSRAMTQALGFVRCPVQHPVRCPVQHPHEPEDAKKSKQCGGWFDPKTSYCYHCWRRDHPKQ